MLSEGNVFATLAVKDLAEAKKFYGETLGLKLVEDSPGGVSYHSGTGKLFVYESPFAGTNQATGASWDVADVAAVVAELKGKGVVFEHYDLPGATVEGDVHVMGGWKAAWFKDPSGNILAVGSTK